MKYKQKIDIQWSSGSNWKKNMENTFQSMVVTDIHSTSRTSNFLNVWIERFITNPEPKKTHKKMYKQIGFTDRGYYISMKFYIFLPKLIGVEFNFH